MAYYEFPVGHSDLDVPRSVAFCKANGINPRAPIFGSMFEVVDGHILTRELEIHNGARVLHEGCCGTTHFAKTTGKYEMLAPPEAFGFDALRDASGEVAP